MPVGVPAPGGTALRVAVKVTFDPGRAGFSEETTAFAVAAGITVRVPLWYVML
jgi:hypothetical protein